MTESLISVIIPTYKRHPDMLNRAIKSVQTQTYTNLEIIIVDDSPHDYMDRVLIENMIYELCDNRVHYIKHEKNLGACAARNTGISNSKGDFIAFLDDDDEWLPTKLEKQILKMANSNTGLVYCKQVIINDTTQNETYDNRKCLSGKVFHSLLKANFIGSTSFVLIRKECFEYVGRFNTDLESAQDYELWLRIAQDYMIDYVNEHLVKYHIHESERISANANKKIQGLEMLNEIYADYLNNHKAIKSIRLIRIVPYYLKLNDKTKAWDLYKQAVKLSPLEFKRNLYYLFYFIKKGEIF